MSPITWFKVDDGFWSHPKTVGLSDAAVALWVRAGAYASQHLTDGAIPAPVLRMVGERAAAEELVTAGLWEETAGGYLFHDWAEYQETSSTVKERRAAARDRQRRSRAAREAKKDRGRGHDSADVTRDNTREFSTPDPTRPDPVVTDVTTDPPTPQPGGTLVPLRPPRGGKEVAARWAGLAHSAEAHTIARAYERHNGSPIPGQVLIEIAQRVDECLASNVAPDQIERGLLAWQESKITATSQIPSFVHKASAKPRPTGRSKPSERAMDAQQIAEQLIAGGATSA